MQVDNEFFVTRCQPPAALRPADAALDRVATAKALSVEERPPLLVLARRDHALESSSREVASHAETAIALSSTSTPGFNRT
jgi:hypothetical protein